MSDSERLQLIEQIRAMEKRLAELLSRMPAHSTPPGMIAELDTLEESLAEARSALKERNNND